MTIDLFALVFLALISMAGISFVKASEHHRLQKRLVAYQLSFPRNLEKESVARACWVHGTTTALVEALAGNTVRFA
jgi:hypothetical protein